ncbi:helix-turn-helix domain-containing protein [Liquorilactobacillus mali]|nr:helix-turn-helix transcriptional regulator [Liquorilactobacillus mali]EJF00205.1 prophage ps3 protein 15 [Liquorilactobacillus mali KCTC 3596 = DSM 20444]QFQ74215.1 helix-turn-helix transcriptional regulator [Liquorilactobacillus mali]
MNENEKRKVGNRVKSIRVGLGLTMDEFAKKIDSSAKSGTIANWEMGKNAPNKKRLKKIAELGDVSVNYLLHGTGLSLKDIETLENKFVHSPSELSEKDKIAAKDSAAELKEVSLKFYEKTINDISSVFDADNLRNLSSSELVLAHSMAILLFTADKTKNPIFSTKIGSLLSLISFSISKKDKTILNETRKAFDSLIIEISKINNRD